MFVQSKCGGVWGGGGGYITASAPGLRLRLLQLLLPVQQYTRWTKTMCHGLW